jgi:transketolase
MRKHFYSYLSNLFKSRKDISILLGDIGVFAFKSCFEFDNTRIFNMGIMEQTMIGVASGLSDNKIIPFIHSIAPFVTERCYEQLKLNLGYECKNAFVVSVGNSYDYASLGSTHPAKGMYKGLQRYKLQLLRSF